MKQISIYCFLFSIVLFSCKKDYEVVPSVKLTPIASPTSSSINKMAFPKAAIGYAVCDNSDLLKTTNNGDSWFVDSNFSFPGFKLIKIMFPDSLVGFILAEDGFGTGKILKSTNGGTSWINFTNGNIDPIDMNFPTKLVGYILTSTYQYKTTDGGQFWSNMSFPSSSFEPFLISFANKDTGYVRDFDSELYQTLNGGNSWTQVFSPVGGAREIRFKSGTNGYAVDGGGSIYTTTDGGMAWNTAFASSSSTEFQLRAIDVYNQTGLAVGDLSIVVSKNNGQSWEYRRTDVGITPQVTFTDVHMTSDASGIACATNGTIYKIILGSQ
jgi:photosystem II stability/assembly factor-like uncharacterized protein